MSNTLKDPWKTWTFNQQFFTELDAWNSRNPETTIDLVLIKICDTIDLTENIRSLIPDNPFPAKSLIEGLCHLIKLGTVCHDHIFFQRMISLYSQTIHSVKRDIYNFVKEIGKWVSREAAAYQQANTAKDSKFTRQTWENLKEIQ